MNDYHVENIINNPYIGLSEDGTKRIPHPRQAVFLCNKMNQKREVLFGGAAGGGKSDAILMAALQYVHIPGYQALILRRTYADLALPGAIMDRAHSWIKGKPGVKWNDKEKTYEFDSGAKLTFGYLESKDDHYRYQGANFHFVGFDELTQFPEHQYKYLFSRLRRGIDSKIPIRMRAGSNPGGRGHEWVKKRFIDNPYNDITKERRVFVKSKIEDNPSLDADEYILSLSELDSVERKRLQHGDWNITEKGKKFSREWVKFINRDEVPVERLQIVRYWDNAATEPTGNNKPDFTVGLKLGFDPTTLFHYILDVQRFQYSPGKVMQAIKSTAEMDGRSVPIRMEREGGSAGKFTGYQFQQLLSGFDFVDKPSTGSKEIRFNPVSIRMENYPGTWFVVNAEWNESFINELELFPHGDNDDQVDGLSGAYFHLHLGGGAIVEDYIQQTEPTYRTGDITLVGDKYIDQD